MEEVIVIGGGIIGATITMALRKQGRDVLLLDDKRQLGGTAPSGGHLKPSWFGGMPSSEYEPAMRLLDEVWGLEEEEFVVRPVGIKTTVFRVDTDLVVGIPKTKATVTVIENLNGKPSVTLEDGTEYRCELLIVAAGAWCHQLLPEIITTAKQGISFRLRGNVQPFIKLWAPYKQVVAHQQGRDEVWVGDGSAILAKNWTKEREQACLSRCVAQTGPMTVIRQIRGLRPYCDTGADPCLLKQVGPSVWVATGAGKLGTIAAGWVARRILNATS